MATFEIGKKYFTTSACDHNCVFVVEIVKRTAKTVTFRRDGQKRRAKIYTDHDGEYISPERYSMAPVFRASSEYLEAEEGEEAPEPVVKTAEVPVTLTHVALKSLDVTERPYRVYYGDDMEFDAAGMKATAVYNDGSTAELTADDVTADSSGKLAAGTEYVTVAYDDGESEVTADVPITVVPHDEYEDEYRSVEIELRGGDIREIQPVEGAGRASQGG